jgi:hypothetical protein
MYIYGFFYKQLSWLHGRRKPHYFFSFMQLKKYFYQIRGFSVYTRNLKLYSKYLCTMCPTNTATNPNLSDSRWKAERNKPTVKKPIKQIADMTKSRYDKKQAIMNKKPICKKPICKKADTQKADMTKGRATSNKKPIWKKADLVNLSKP